MSSRRVAVPTCDVRDLESGIGYPPASSKVTGRWFEDFMNEEEVEYKNTLYDLAIIAEHDKSNGNLVCPRCHKEYHMLDFDEDEAELRQEADHGPYECWQTHLEMGFCEATETDPKGQGESSDSDGT